MAQAHIDKERVFRIVVALKTEKGWSRVQWKLVAAAYLQQTGLDQSNDKVFQKTVRQAYQAYSYPSRQRLLDAFQRYDVSRDTSLLDDVLATAVSGKLNINAWLDDKQRTALWWAAERALADTVRHILSMGTAKVNNADQYGRTPLHIASRLGHTDVVALLLSVSNIDVDTFDRRHQTPLHAASREGHADVVSLLLDQGGASVNETDQGRTTPLYMACRMGRAAVVSVLLAADRIAVNRSAMPSQMTPLAIASHEGHVDVVTLLLAKDGVAVNRVDRHNVTPLLAATTQCEDAVVALLLAHPTTNPNTASAVGQTPLCEACDDDTQDTAGESRAKKRIVKALLGHPDIEVNLKGANQRTPLYTTIYSHSGRPADTSMAEALLKHPDIDVNTLAPDWTPLMLACEQGAMAFVQLLLGDPNIMANKASAGDGATPLFVACQNGRQSVVQRLLQAPDIDVNLVRRSDYVSPLMIACEREREAIVHMLLAVPGIDVDAPNKLGMTALMKTVSPDTVRRLLDAGANINHRTPRTRTTALSEAVYKRRPEVLSVLLHDTRLEIDIGFHDGPPVLFALRQLSYSVLDQLLGTFRVRGASAPYIRGVYVSGARVRRETSTSWSLVKGDNQCRIEMFDGRITRRAFSQLDAVPSNTFRLHAKDIVTLADEIEAPVRCLPCKHPFHAGSLHAYFGTPTNPQNPHVLPTQCPLCKQDVTHVEIMNAFQVKRWNAMEAESSTFEKTLAALRPSLEKSPLFAVYKQSVAAAKILQDNEANAARLQKERADLERQIEALRQKRGEVIHAAGDAQQVVDATRIQVASLRQRLARDPEFQTKVQRRAAAKKALEQNKLTNRYTQYVLKEY